MSLLYDNINYYDLSALDTLYFIFISNIINNSVRPNII